MTSLQKKLFIGGISTALILLVVWAICFKKKNRTDSSPLPSSSPPNSFQPAPTNIRFRCEASLFPLIHTLNDSEWNNNQFHFVAEEDQGQILVTALRLSGLINQSEEKPTFGPILWISSGATLSLLPKLKDMFENSPNEFPLIVSQPSRESKQLLILNPKEVESFFQNLNIWRAPSLQ